MGDVVSLAQFRRDKQRRLGVGSMVVDYSLSMDEATLEFLTKRLKKLNESIPYGRTVIEREQIVIEGLEVQEMIINLKRKIAETNKGKENG